MKYDNLWIINIYQGFAGPNAGRYELVFTDQERAVKCYQYIKRIHGMRWWRPSLIHCEDDFGTLVSIEPQTIGVLYFSDLINSHRRATDVQDSQHVIAEKYSSDVKEKTGFSYRKDKSDVKEKTGFSYGKI